jgi:hypothetical protein
MATRVFELRQFVDDNRPMLVSKWNPALDKASLMNYGIVRGDPGCTISDWTPWDDIYLVPPEKLGGAASGISIKDQDYFDFPSTSGLFSKRAVDALGPYLEHCFIPLPSTVEWVPFFFLHTKRTIDALNIAESDIAYVGTKVIAVDRYRFYKKRLNDPLIFSAPQIVPCVFVTDSIPEIVEKAGLTGFVFPCVDGLD